MGHSGCFMGHLGWTGISSLSTSFVWAMVEPKVVRLKHRIRSCGLSSWHFCHYNHLAILVTAPLPVSVLAYRWLYPVVVEVSAFRLGLYIDTCWFQNSSLILLSLALTFHSFHTRRWLLLVQRAFPNAKEQLRIRPRTLRSEHERSSIPIDHNLSSCVHFDCLNKYIDP